MISCFNVEGMKGIYFLTSERMQRWKHLFGDVNVLMHVTFFKKKKSWLGSEMFARIPIISLSGIVWLIFWDYDEAETLQSLTAASMLPPPGLSQPYRQEMKRSGLLKPLELMSGCWCGGCTHLSTAWGAALGRYCAGAPQAATLETFKGREELTSPVSTRR